MGLRLQQLFFLVMLEKTAKAAIVGKDSVQRLSCDRESRPTGIFNGKKQTELLTRVYEARMSSMYKITEICIQSFQSLGFCDIQVLVLGCGFDTSYNSLGNQVYIVDLPDVMCQRKVTCKSWDLSHVQLISGDLRSISSVMSSLTQVSFDPRLPTLVILESVLAYLDHASSQAILHALSHLPLSFTVIYDPLSSSSPSLIPCALELQSSFSSRGAPLLSPFTSPSHACTALRKEGFPHVESYTIRQLLSLSVNTSPSTSPRDLFDEFAALSMLHNMYAITVSSTCTMLFSALHRGIFASCSSQALSVRISVLASRLLSYSPPPDSASRCPPLPPRSIPPSLTCT
jgi:hypothetical protein